MAVYDLTLTVLSPLHIGDGGELAQGFDFLVRQGRTYRLNVDAVLAARGAQMRPDRAGNYPLPAKLLQPADLDNPAFFRYQILGSPSSKKENAIVKSCIKDVYDYPYIPGSSLKGTLRTVLAWCGLFELNPNINRQKFGINNKGYDQKKPKPEKAGNELEKDLFGKSSNYDLLRALHVSDLLGNHKPAQCLTVINAQVINQKGIGVSVSLEAIAKNKAFKGTLKIDETLFSPAAERELGFANHRRWLDELLPRAQQHAQARIKQLLAWFEQADGYPEVAEFYRQLANASLPPNQALLQLGWGAGWDGKTFWTHLQKDADLFDQLVSDFHMQKVGRGAPRRKASDFPLSKRIARINMTSGDITNPMPMGWVLLEITPRKD